MSLLEAAAPSRRLTRPYSVVRRGPVSSTTMRTSVWVLFTLTLLPGCERSAQEPDTPRVDVRPPMAAASGVARADGGKSPREYRVIPLRPMSGDVEILYGDPEVPGEPFVMRIRELPGTIVPPHSHPVDEHITVVQGTWYFGRGETFDAQALEELSPGSYAFAPKGSSMFGYAPEEAIVQVHGIGPFNIHWHSALKTLDDADAPSSFHLKKGQQVLAARGRIVQGYASGEILQYEIETLEGEHFMARENELQVQ